MLCRLLDYVAEAINAALQQQLARLRPSDRLAAAPLLDLSTMPFVGVLEAPPAPRQAEGEVAGLPELLRAYGAERAWARVCAALRGALHEAPPLEGLEPLALPLPGGEAEVRRTLLELRSLRHSTYYTPALTTPLYLLRHSTCCRVEARTCCTTLLTTRLYPTCKARLALLDAPGGLLPLLCAAELQLAASPPPGAESLLHASVAKLASSSAQGGEGGSGALLSPSGNGQAFVLRHYHAPLKYECALLLVGVRRSIEPSEAALLCLQASSLPQMRTLLAGRGTRGAARARRGGGGSSSLLATQLSAMRELLARCEASAPLTTLCCHPSPAPGGPSFDREAMSAQLRAFSLAPLARALATGLPEQLSTAAFLGRFRCLAPINEARLQQTFLLDAAASPEELRHGSAALLGALPLRSDDVALGHSSVLMRAATLRHLDRLRAARLAVAATRVAAAARGWRVRATLRRLGAAQASDAAVRTALLRPSALNRGGRTALEVSPPTRPRPPAAPVSLPYGGLPYCGHTSNSSSPRDGARSEGSPRHALAPSPQPGGAGSPLYGSSPVGGSPVSGSPRQPLRAGPPVFPPEIGFSLSAADGGGASGVGGVGGAGGGEPSEYGQDVAMKAVELGMDLTADRAFLHLAAEALAAPMPEGWQPRTDALGQLYYVDVASGASSRAHPATEHYQRTFYALKLQQVVLLTIAILTIAILLLTSYQSPGTTYRSPLTTHDAGGVSPADALTRRLDTPGRCDGRTARGGGAPC